MRPQSRGQSQSSPFGICASIWCFRACQASRPGWRNGGKITTTLEDVAAKKSEQSAEQQAAAELIGVAREQGVSLTGPGGQLKQLHQGSDRDGTPTGDDRATRPRETRLRGCGDAEHPQRAA